jgi:hypothetical protein
MSVDHRDRIRQVERQRREQLANQFQIYLDQSHITDAFKTIITEILSNRGQFERGWTLFLTLPF